MWRLVPGRKPPATIQPDTSVQDDGRLQLAFAQDILDKRYQTYMWCEQKIYTLATANTIFLGGLFVIAGSRYSADTIPKRLLLAACVLCFAISLTLVLYHIEPKMSSGTLPATEKNPRSVVGVRKYASFDEYTKVVSSLTVDEMLTFTAHQIYGMNKNIWKNQRATRWAVVADVLGLALFLVIVLNSNFTIAPSPAALGLVK